MRQTSVSLLSRTIALLCALAWFVASNHCALSALADGLTKSGATAVQCKHCPTKDDGTGNSGAPSGMSGCCKGIKATAASSGMADFAPVLGGSLLATVVAVIQSAPTPNLESGTVGTGPPRSLSFAEAMLSRSFQSHAPPLIG